MLLIEGKDRIQMQFFSLEDRISEGNPVRFVEAFVERIELDKLGFIIRTPKTEGRPAYHPKLMLKIYLYGYLNNLRSSRKLERECGRNTELQWLTGDLRPNYHTIADFRKDNPKALRSMFKLFVLFLRDSDLVGSTAIAIDGTKVRASNSKKNNFGQKKIDRHLAYIEEKTSEYLSQLDANDVKDDQIKINDIKEKIERLKGNKLHYDILGTSLAESGATQISTTDSDARALLVQGQVVEVSYNVQAAVDDKHKLVIATHTINRNDRNALSGIVTESKENLEADSFTVLVDKGYHNGREISRSTEAGITTIVAPAQIVNSNDKGTTPEYMVDKFDYDASTDTYTCPQGERLSTKGTWHKKSRERDSYQYKKYRTAACKTCPVKHLCTGRAQGGREIERSEFAAAVQANNQRYKENQALYRKRQEINEHIFGTIKRGWSYGHTNLRGLEKVNGEYALIMTVYNMKRSINILGMPKILEKLKKWTPDYQKVVIFVLKRLFKTSHSSSRIMISKVAA